jgi:hypothetical protein
VGLVHRSCPQDARTGRFLPSALDS